MKRAVKLSVVFIIYIALSSCMTMHTNTKAPIISDNAVPKLYVKHPLAIRNASLNSGDIIIGKWIGGWKVLGDLYKYTESSVGAARNILERQNIKIEDDASRVLELSVFDVKSLQGNKFTVTTVLRVRTGNGLKKEYEEVKHHGNGYGTTAVIEQALADCVAQMLNDKDIINYLEN